MFQPTDMAATHITVSARRAATARAAARISSPLWARSRSWATIPALANSWRSLLSPRRRLCVGQWLWRRRHGRHWRRRNRRRVRLDRCVRRRHRNQRPRLGFGERLRRRRLRPAAMDWAAARHRPPAMTQLHRWRADPGAERRHHDRQRRDCRGHAAVGGDGGYDNGYGGDYGGDGGDWHGRHWAAILARNSNSGPSSISIVDAFAETAASLSSMSAEPAATAAMALSGARRRWRQRRHRHRRYGQNSSPLRAMAWSRLTTP